MKNIKKQSLKDSLHTAENLYYRLILLVGEPNSGQTMLLNELAKELNLKVININLTVAKALLELNVKQRTRVLSECLAHLTEEANTLIILDNIEILFDKHLQHDALKLLQQLSRHCTIIASWSGKISGDQLIYAETNHPEYQSYELKDLLIIDLNNA